MVGVIDEERHVTTQYFKEKGDVIFLLGRNRTTELGASHFLKVCHGRKEGLPPRLNIELELAVQNATRDLIRAGLLKERARLLRGRTRGRSGGMLFQSRSLVRRASRAGTDGSARGSVVVQRDTIPHHDLRRSGK